MESSPPRTVSNCLQARSASQHIFGALGSDHSGSRFARDVRNIQDMVVMCVSSEIESAGRCAIRWLQRPARQRHSTDTRGACLQAWSGPQPPPGGAGTIITRQMWIGIRGSGGSIGDFPARGSQVFEDDLIAISCAAFVLSRSEFRAESPQIQIPRSQISPFGMHLQAEHPCDRQAF